MKAESQFPWRSRALALVPAAGARITTVRGVYLIITLFVAVIIFFAVLPTFIRYEPALGPLHLLIKEQA